MYRSTFTFRALFILSLLLLGSIAHAVQPIPASQSTASTLSEDFGPGGLLPMGITDPTHELDPIGHPLSYAESSTGDTLFTVASFNYVNGSGVEVNLTTVPNAFGNQVFTFTVTDSDSFVATYTWDVTFTPVPDAPVAVADAYVTDYNTVLNEPAAGVLANDTDVEGDTLAAVLDSGASNGLVVLNGYGHRGHYC